MISLAENFFAPNSIVEGVVFISSMVVVIPLSTTDQVPAQLAKYSTRTGSGALSRTISVMIPLELYLPFLKNSLVPRKPRLTRSIGLYSH